jgi:hypothetical protein
MAVASVHACAPLTLSPHLLTLWNKRFTPHSSLRPSHDCDQTDSFNAAISSLSELIRIGLVSPHFLRLHHNHSHVICPSTRILVSYTSTWSFEQNKRTGFLLFAGRRPSPLLLSLRTYDPNHSSLRYFRTRTRSSGLGIDREVVHENQAAADQPQSQPSDSERAAATASGKLHNLKIDEADGNLSINEQNLTPDEINRVRVSERTANNNMQSY